MPICFRHFAPFVSPCIPRWWYNSCLCLPGWLAELRCRCEQIQPYTATQTHTDTHSQNASALEHKCQHEPPTQFIEMYSPICQMGFGFHTKTHRIRTSFYVIAVHSFSLVRSPPWNIFANYIQPDRHLHAYTYLEGPHHMDTSGKIKKKKYEIK